jgi:hypothetical protein
MSRAVCRPATTKTAMAAAALLRRDSRPSVQFLGTKLEGSGGEAERPADEGERFQTLNAGGSDKASRILFLLRIGRWDRLRVGPPVNFNASQYSDYLTFLSCL